MHLYINHLFNRKTSVFNRESSFFSRYRDAVGVCFVLPAGAGGGAGAVLRTSSLSENPPLESSHAAGGGMFSHRNGADGRAQGTSKRNGHFSKYKPIIPQGQFSTLSAFSIENSGIKLACILQFADRLPARRAPRSAKVIIFNTKFLVIPCFLIQNSSVLIQNSSFLLTRPAP